MFLLSDPGTGVPTKTRLESSMQKFIPPLAIIIMIMVCFQVSPQLCPGLFRPVPAVPPVLAFIYCLFIVLFIFGFCFLVLSFGFYVFFFGVGSSVPWMYVRLVLDLA